MAKSHHTNAATKHTLSLVAIVMIQLVSFWDPRATFLCVLPLLILAKDACNKTTNALRPMRFYLTCILISATSLWAEVNQVISALASAAEAELQVHPLITLQPILPLTIVRITVPLVIGIIGLIAFGQVEAEREGEAEPPRDWFEKLEQFLSQSDAPQELLGFLKDLGGEVNQSQKRLSQLSKQSKAATDSVENFVSATSKLTQVVESLIETSQTTNRQVNKLSADVNGATTDIRQIQSAVGQMGDVLDQFSEVASHQVLQYQPNKPEPESLQHA